MAVVSSYFIAPAPRTKLPGPRNCGRPGLHNTSKCGYGWWATAQSDAVSKSWCRNLAQFPISGKVLLIAAPWLIRQYLAGGAKYSIFISRQSTADKNHFLGRGVVGIVALVCHLILFTAVPSIPITGKLCGTIDFESYGIIESAWSNGFNLFFFIQEWFDKVKRVNMLGLKNFRFDFRRFNISAVPNTLKPVNKTITLCAEYRVQGTC